ncbi:MAG: 3-deoxy-manno-octulosonate cytidylyltransferase [Planctomycetes bacterium]|nr:3-deoxy-manno-octulosonate cytidylyltransferase [Planctomycetota bacterium]
MSASAPASGPRAIALVPARLASQRLPRKMLLARTGTPLFAHTVANVRSSGAFARVVLATDAEEILDTARRAGIEAVMTRLDHTSGTDRIHEAWKALERAGERADVLVNVQGDEPELAPEDLARLVLAFTDPAVEMATLCGPIERAEDAERPNVVKVVRDRSGDALYFSRARIPASGHARDGGTNSADWTIHRRHIGVYAFTPVALESFRSLPTGRLEVFENLEQLRWLEAGRRIRVLDAERVPEGIDTEADYERFVARWAARGGPPPGSGGVTRIDERAARPGSGGAR